jgi:hypothetical protein
MDRQGHGFSGTTQAGATVEERRFSAAKARPNSNNFCHSEPS